MLASKKAANMQAGDPGLHSTVRHNSDRPGSSQCCCICTCQTSCLFCAGPEIRCTVLQHACSFGLCTKLIVRKMNYCGTAVLLLDMTIMSSIISESVLNLQCHGYSYSHFHDTIIDFLLSIILGNTRYLKIRSV